MPLPFRTALLAGFALATEDPATAIPAMWAGTFGMHRANFRYVLTDWPGGPRFRPLLVAAEPPQSYGQDCLVSGLLQT